MSWTRAFLVGCMLFSMTLVAEAEFQDTHHLTVCEVLREGSRLNGKRIAVRGRVTASRHGFHMDAPDCSGIEVILGRKWERAVVLGVERTDSSSSDSKGDRLSSVQILDRLLMFLHHGYSLRELRVQLTATFVGTVDWADPHDRTAEGFGMNNALVRVRFDDVRDIVIKSDGLRGCE
jgi:hypothetical protein